MSIHWIWLPYNNHIIFSSIHPEYTQDTFGYAMHFAHCAYGRKETGTLHRLGAAPAVGCLSGRLLMPPQPPPDREVEGMVLQAENRREHRIPKSSWCRVSACYKSTFDSIPYTSIISRFFETWRSRKHQFKDGSESLSIPFFDQLKRLKLHKALRERDPTIPDSWPAIVAAAYANLGWNWLHRSRLRMYMFHQLFFSFFSTTGAPDDSFWARNEMDSIQWLIGSKAPVLPTFTEGHR
jgi:hypothetical protein